MGAGRFVDDLDLEGQLWARIVRSHIAHGRIREVDTSRAEAMKGVACVLTHPDVTEVAPIPLRLRLSRDSLEWCLQPVLAHDRVRYVGEPIAVVVATDPYLAEDAADEVSVSYEPLEPVLEATTAATDPVRLWDGHSNEVATLHMSYGNVDEAFLTAHTVVELDLTVGRHSGVPLETRGLLAAPDIEPGDIRIWGWTKVTHFNREVLADLLGLDINQIHTEGVDAGGGFGIRGEFYPEDLLIPLLASRLQCPVKWIEDRTEHLMSANQSRDQRHRIQGAFNSEGRLAAIRDEVWHDNGAYLRTHGLTVPELTISMLAGPYRLPAFAGTAHVIVTNKTPCGTYRGPGRYEGTFVREQLLTKAATTLGMDPIEIRRRNLLQPEEMPFERSLETLGTPFVLDGGDYESLMDATLEAAHYTEWLEDTERQRQHGKRVGTGIAFVLEKSGLGPYETARVELDGDGQVKVFTGGASLGQGLETVLAQIAADTLDVAQDKIEVIYGDSDTIPDGVGSWASRSTVVGGSAVLRACEGLLDSARDLAAELLGVESTELALRPPGGFELSSGESNEFVDLAEIARQSQQSTEELGPGKVISHSAVFSVDRMTYPYGVHLAQVEVDEETGYVRVLRYFVGYEVGKAINATLVEGQLVGGAVQGLGGALMEEFRFDDAGQPLSTTLIDYLLPTAADVPEVETLITERVPAADNPLGVRGAGEGGCSGVGAAIAAAIEDASGAIGGLRGLPASPERVREILQEFLGDT